MNPTMTAPAISNLVTCLMDDRMAEASERRLAAELPPAEPGSPYRFRRFLADGARRRPRAARPAPIPQGR
jgi:hypothetical protein